MNRIPWKQKLASRKFWALLAALAVSVLGAFGVSEDTTLRVTGIITAVGACAAYMFAEAIADQGAGTGSATSNPAQGATVPAGETEAATRRTDAPGGSLSAAPDEDAG